MNHGELAIPEPFTGSRTTATRVTCGAICLSSSSHFPLKLYSNWVNPVVLPPGRDMLSTYPDPTGSTACTSTIGIVRVAYCNGLTVTLPEVRMTSGPSATNSFACLRRRSTSPPAQRALNSYAAVGPTQFLQAFLNAAIRNRDSGSSSARILRRPTNRMRSCARAMNGQAVAEPATTFMKSRRRM